jgi:Protein of unknown function (DUF3096)
LAAKPAQIAPLLKSPNRRVPEPTGTYRNLARLSCVPQRPPLQEKSMNLHLSLGPLVSLVAGILILVMPKLLNYIIAIYLIVIGIIGLV